MTRSFFAPHTLPESTAVSPQGVHVCCSHLHMRADAPQRQRQRAATKPVRTEDVFDERRVDCAAGELSSNAKSEPSIGEERYQRASFPADGRHGLF